MLRGSGLNCLDKRNLLNQHAVSVETLLRWGKSFEEAELFHDAIDFYEKAGAREPLERILEQALEDGDLFLYKRACRALKIEPDADRWRLLGERAQSQGKSLFMKEAFRLAGVEEPFSGEAAPE
jgi:hypothetical protein